MPVANRLSKISDYQRAIIKAHLCSTGLSYEDLDKPIIAVVNTWNEVSPGHVPLRELAGYVKAGIKAAGGTPLEFNTIAICDGIAQGHAGMRYSLPSRELVSDSVEAMIQGHGIFDGAVLLGSCDKIIPGLLMAAARLNIPSLLLTGGPMINYILAAEHKQDRKRFLEGRLEEKDLVDKTMRYYTGPGVCPFLGTANTMAIVAEALGMSLPGSSLHPAMSALRRQAAEIAGRQAVELVRKGLTPRKILTREAFENAIAVVLAIGGSLNSVLHLLGIAAEAGVNLDIEVFDEVSRRVPLLTSITPNGNSFTVIDFYHAGGVPALLKELLPLINGKVITVSGKTVAENVSQAEILNDKVIRPLRNPIAPAGGIAVLRGNLAPEGALVKVSAVPPEQYVFRGRALIFDREEQALNASRSGRINSGTVVVIRYEGPSGGPGMREMHRITEILQNADNVAVITDGRFSGASAGLSVGYISPEAAAGGPIALVRDGDTIEINIPERRLQLLVEERELEQRRRETKLNGGNHSESNFLQLYAVSTTSAASGAVRKKICTWDK
ncbi:dihydroxy-acid dehydratase [Calderihabitans maritimus]|uniref:Dihydroxy-acid dehydratase n=1 Tax=Calderihabitans maritimus TaxID=1246530 RepID=A0A1Z5HR07_9FIRM|nr:dihydroxy-acid dehydratase [Calderihabitans maritimus]GAW91944.1 dihydroxy-acid dehydratase [Calderihabitans maritimus]